MNKKTLRDLDLKGRKVIMRVDFNVPIENLQVTDDTRIRAALPSINYVLDQGASLVLMSHLGRPSGKGFEAEFSLLPVAGYLQGLLNRQVVMAPDCRGPAVQALAAGLQPGQVLMLENTRFYKEEEGKAKTEGLSDDEAAKKKSEMKARQQAMAKDLAALGEIYVNDAFGAAHRAHASTSVIAQYSQAAVAGFLMEKELDYLGRAMSSPPRPFLAIIGGSKISGKLEVLKSLMQKVDTLIIAGGMAYTFFKANGQTIGTSIHEDELLDTARQTLAAAKAAGVKVLLPVDNTIADKFDAAARTQVVEGNIPDGWMGMDIGPKTIAIYQAAISQAKTIIWNGPMGVFEMTAFAKGTMAVCQAVAANAEACSIVGGGDSVSAVNQSGLAEKFSHISTGGGASLEYLEGKTLPGVKALNDK